MKKIFILFVLILVFSCKNDDDAYYSNTLKIERYDCSVDGFVPDYCFIVRVNNDYEKTKSVTFEVFYQENGNPYSLITQPYDVDSGIHNVKINFYSISDDFCDWTNVIIHDVY